MGSYTRTYNFTNGTTAYGSQVAFELDALGTSVNNIVNAQIASGAAIADSKLAQISTASKVKGQALTVLGDIPSGAGEVPAANLNIASAAEMTTGTDTEALATAANVASHEGVAKAWVNFDGASVDGVADLTGVGDSFNVTSVVDNGVGDYTLAWDTNFGSANYCLSGMAQDVSNNPMLIDIDSTDGLAAGSARVNTRDDSNVARDPAIVGVVAIGDR